MDDKRSDGDGVGIREEVEELIDRYADRSSNPELLRAMGQAINEVLFEKVCSDTAGGDTGVAAAKWLLETMDSFEAFLGGVRGPLPN